MGLLKKLGVGTGICVAVLTGGLLLRSSMRSNSEEFGKSYRSKPVSVLEDTVPENNLDIHDFVLSSKNNSSSVKLPNSSAHKSYFSSCNNYLSVEDLPELRDALFYFVGRLAEVKKDDFTLKDSPSVQGSILLDDFNIFYSRNPQSSAFYFDCGNRFFLKLLYDFERNTPVTIELSRSYTGFSNNHKHAPVGELLDELNVPADLSKDFTAFYDAFRKLY